MKKLLLALIFALTSSLAIAATYVDEDKNKLVTSDVPCQVSDAAIMFMSQYGMSLSKDGVEGVVNEKKVCAASLTNAVGEKAILAVDEVNKIVWLFLLEQEVK